MHQNKIFLNFLIPALMLTSCIKPYDPVINKTDTGKYVVSGQLTDFDGNQLVSVSMTSPVGDPQLMPISGCTVVISDNRGNDFLLTEGTAGNYNGFIDAAYLEPGVSYKVSVHTPDGTDIISGYDQMPAGPPIDSVYYLRLDLPTPDKDVFTKGIQFYVDLNSSDIFSRYYMWEAIETWEYHSEYPLEWYYDGSMHHVVPPDFSRQICWKTSKVKDIFTLTTRNLTENKFRQFPLHYVSNKTVKLVYGYSLLIKQYALSEPAFAFWENMKINNTQSGGLYGKQPLAVKGNMQNLSDPNSEVLGFFCASSMRAKRIFIRQVEGLELDYFNVCTPRILLRGLSEISPWQYPAYLLGHGSLYEPVLLNEECVNCMALSLGGKNVKPDFWPN